MSKPPSFAAYARAVAVLLRHFPAKASGKESPADYSFSHDIDLSAAWQRILSELIESLSPASFVCELRLRIQDYTADFTMKLVSGQAMANCQAASTQPPVLPTDAVATFEEFERMTNGNVAVGLGDLLNAIAVLRAHDSSTQLTFKTFLQKNLIASTVGFQPSGKQKIAYYLFAENLRQRFAHTPLEQFEADFCETNQRTVILTLDTEGLIAGELLLICGPEHEADIVQLDAQPLSKETGARSTAILDLRKAEMLGNFSLEWLTPDFFSVSPAEPNEPPVFDLIRNELRGHQALLATLFMADYVEPSKHGYHVEYRGIRTTKLEIDRNSLLGYAKYFDDVCKLYGYAYDALVADKLEIVQQFLSLMATSVEALCTRATEIREAAEKNYAIVMKEKVAVYFDALEKVEDRIRAALEKSAKDAIDLSREVSADVYKVAGVIAAAFVGMLLKPELAWLVSVASFVMFLYLLLVVFYHLATQRAAYDLAMIQHAAYINSFREILGPTKTAHFLYSDHLQSAQTLFNHKYEHARDLYIIVMTLALIVALITFLHKALSPYSS